MRNWSSTVRVMRRLNSAAVPIRISRPTAMLNILSPILTRMSHSRHASGYRKMVSKGSKPVLDRAAPHVAALREVVAAAAMQHRAVVPHHQVTRPPFVAIDELPLRRMLQEIGEQHPPFGQR